MRPTRKSSYWYESQSYKYQTKGCAREQKSKPRHLGRYIFFKVGPLSYVAFSMVSVLGENAQFTSSTNMKEMGGHAEEIKTNITMFASQIQKKKEEKL